MSKKPKRLLQLMFGCLATASAPLTARPASYVPDQQWTKEAWKCREGNLSSLEIASNRTPTATAKDLRVSALRVDGKQVLPKSVEGLEEFLAGLGAIQSISGRCGWTGEFISIRGFVREGPDLRLTQDKRFFIPYRR